MLQYVESPDKIPTKFANDDTYKSWSSKNVSWSKEPNVNAVSVCWDRDGDLRESQYPCHNYVLNFPMHDTTELHNTFCKQMTPKAEAFIQYLLSEESPYRALWSGEPEVFAYRGPKSGRIYSIHFTQMQDMPIKLLANFLIASRAHSGWGLATLWHYLVDNSFTKTEALLLSNPFAMYDQNITLNNQNRARFNDNWRSFGYFIFHGYAYSDKPFHICSHNQNLRKGTSITRLEKADPDLFLGNAVSKGKTDAITLKEGAKPNPSNAIWDGSTPDYRVISEKLALRTHRKDTHNPTTHPAILKRNDEFVWAAETEHSMFLISKNFYDDKPLPSELVTKLKEYLHAEKTIDF